MNKKVERAHKKKTKKKLRERERENIKSPFK